MRKLRVESRHNLQVENAVREGKIYGFDDLLIVKIFKTLYIKVEGFALVRDELP